MFKKVTYILIFALTFNILQPIKNSQAVPQVATSNTLIDAVINNDIGLTRYLLRLGLDVNTTTSEGVTPLMIAIRNKNTEMMSLLLKNGADVNAVDDFGNNVYCYGKYSDKKRIQKILKRNGARDSGTCNLANFEVVKERGINSSMILGALVIGGVAAGGGGGGGGGDALVGDVEQEIEYLQAKLNLIDAQAMYDAGYTGLYTSGAFSGDKVKIAIIDDGVDINHVTLRDNISDELTGTNISIGGDDPSPTDFDVNKHGTHVAGIMIGKRDGFNMHGVSPDAELLPYNVTDPINVDVESIDQELVSQALNDIINVKNPLFTLQGESEVIAINNSYGTPTTFNFGAVVIDASDINSSTDIDSLINDVSLLSQNFVDSVKATLAEGIIMVWAAGNESNAHPSIQAGLVRGFDGVGEEDYDEYTIAVVASNANGTEIASYSNRCGATKDYCLMAPGTEIVSTFPGNVYGILSGTSMAAPMVTGAIALVKGAAPSLGNDEVVDIILGTATDMGAVGVDDIYGHGMLNLEAALAPIGTLTVTPVTNPLGVAIPVFGGGIAAVGALESTFRLFNEELMVLDSYKRSYYINTNDLIDINKSDKNINNYFTHFVQDNKMLGGNVELGKNTQLGFNISERASNEDIDDYHSGYSVNLNHNFTKSNFVKSIVLNLNKDFDSNNSLFISHTSNPYLDFISNKSAFFEDSSDNSVEQINASFKLNNNMSFNFTNSIIFSDINNELERFVDNSIDVEWGRQFNNFNVNFKTGITQENDTLLGSYFDGVFDGIEGAVANFYGTNLSYDFNKKLSFFANYIIGYSVANISNVNSLIEDVSDISSNSFDLGFVYEGKKGEKKLGFILSQPLRINKGTMSVQLPQDRDYETNTILFNSYNLSLEPSGRELDLELFYQNKIGKNIKSKFGLMHIVDKNHDSNAEVETIGMMNLSRKF